MVGVRWWEGVVGGRARGGGVGREPAAAARAPGSPLQPPWPRRPLTAATAATASTAAPQACWVVVGGHGRQRCVGGGRAGRVGGGGRRAGGVGRGGRAGGRADTPPPWRRRSPLRVPPSTFPPAPPPPNRPLPLRCLLVISPGEWRARPSPGPPRLCGAVLVGGGGWRVRGVGGGVRLASSGVSWGGVVSVCRGVRAGLCGRGGACPPAAAHPLRPVPGARRTACGCGRRRPPPLASFVTPIGSRCGSARPQGEGEAAWVPLRRCRRHRLPAFGASSPP